MAKHEHQLRQGELRALLAEFALRCEPLPTARARPTLRPTAEIVARAGAMDVLLHHLAFETSTDILRRAADRSDLRKWMLDDERALFDLPREEARERGAARVAPLREALWPLCWIVSPASVLPVMTPSLSRYDLDRGELCVHRNLDGQMMKLITYGFLTPLRTIVALAPFVAVSATRTVGADEVALQEHIYSAVQQGLRHAPVDDGARGWLDPGVLTAIDARLLALRWALSPGADWGAVSSAVAAAGWSDTPPNPGPPSTPDPGRDRAFAALRHRTLALDGRDAVMPVEIFALANDWAETSRGIVDGGNVAYRELQALVGHPHRFVRRTAWQALRRIAFRVEVANAAGALERLLLAGLEDAEGWVRYDAAWALADIGLDTPSLRTALRALAAGYDPTIKPPPGGDEHARYRAALTLAKLESAAPAAN
jgi:hypothetical protein